MKKKLTPRRYLVQKNGQPKKRRHCYCDGLDIAQAHHLTSYCNDDGYHISENNRITGNFTVRFRTDSTVTFDDMIFSWNCVNTSEVEIPDSVADGTNMGPFVVNFATDGYQAGYGFRMSWECSDNAETPFFRTSWTFEQNWPPKLFF